MNMINVEPKENYILRADLDDGSVVDFNVKAELERIPSAQSTLFCRVTALKSRSWSACRTMNHQPALRQAQGERIMFNTRQNKID
jgi:hypothetical protein